MNLSGPSIPMDRAPCRPKFHMHNINIPPILPSFTILSKLIHITHPSISKRWKLGAFVINMQSIEGLSSHYCNQRWSVVSQLSLNFLNKSQVVFINSSLKKKTKNDAEN